MASQYGAVTGKRIKNPARDMLNAQLPYLPNMVAAKQDRQMREKAQQLEEDQFAEQKRFNEAQQRMAEKKYAHTKQVEKAHMGLKAGEMGMKFLSGEGNELLRGLPGFGKKSGGASLAKWFQGDDAMKDMTNPVLRQAAQKQLGASSPSWFSGAKNAMNLGTTLAPGMMGFGVGSLMKKKPWAIGAGAGLGALTGLMKGGGWGSLWGGLSGGLGGFLSGLL
jgi:hypothetical protein